MDRAGQVDFRQRGMGDDILGKTHFVAQCVSMEMNMVHLPSGEEPGLMVGQELRGTRLYVSPVCHVGGRGTPRPR